MTNILTNEQICEVIGWVGKDLDGWLCPGMDFVATPPFSTSLDACFEWLVPWLEEIYGVDNISFYRGDILYVDNNVLCTLEYIKEDVDCIKQGTDKSPSLAFIKAFSALVEGR